MPRTIKVLVVDDSMLFRNLIIQRLSQQSNIEIIGYAINAFDAKRKIPQLHPDVVTLDVEMPGLNGIEFVKQLIPTHPVPVILVSSLNLSVFEALSAGAIDFVRKPDMSQSNSIETFFNLLINKVQIASTAKVQSSANRVIAAAAMPKDPIRLTSANMNSTVIAIGASTGGTEATLSVLKALPANTPGIVVTQHMPEGFTKMYAERLDRLCQMKVKEAENGDRILPGQVLIASGDRQMKVVKMGPNYTVNCFFGEKVSGHCPSVDVLFQSMATAVGSKGVGVILTGMGRDGADGLLAMKRAGAYTIGQDKESCVVYGMPMVAYNIGAVATQSSLLNIPNLLRNYLNKL